MKAIKRQIKYLFTLDVQKPLQFIVGDIVGVNGAAGDPVYIFYIWVMT